MPSGNFSVSDQFGASLQAQIDAITVGSNAYVGGSNVTPLTVASLISTYPPSASNLGKYARVSDLYGSVDEIMRCRFDGVNYNWVPQRESASGTSAATSGTVNFVPLVTPTTLIFSGTSLLGNVSILPSNVNAYNGQPAELVLPSALALGIYTMTITNLVGSNVTLGSGQTRRLRYMNGWVLLP